MTFKGYGNSECPNSDCPKGCNHSPTRNGSVFASRASIVGQENAIRSRHSTDRSSRSTIGTSRTTADESYSSERPSRAQSDNTSPSTSPSLEKQDTKLEHHQKESSVAISDLKQGAGEISNSSVSTIAGSRCHC